MPQKEREEIMNEFRWNDAGIDHHHLGEGLRNRCL